MPEFAAEFARTMLQARFVAEVEDGGRQVSVGWSDNLAAVFVDIEPAYKRYLKRPADLDAILDKLCNATDRKMPKHLPRGWDS